VFASSYTYFGAAEVDIYVTAAAKAAKGTLTIAVNRMSTVDSEVSNVCAEEPVQLNDGPFIASPFSFTATSGASYSIFGILSGEQPTQIKSVSIMARSRPIAA
jgi:hypothetical protein